MATYLSNSSYRKLLFRNYHTRIQTKTLLVRHKHTDRHTHQYHNWNTATIVLKLENIKLTKIVAKKTIFEIEIAQYFDIFILWQQFILCPRIIWANPLLDLVLVPNLDTPFLVKMRPGHHLSCGMSCCQREWELSAMASNT